MTPVMNGDVTALNESFDPAEGQPGVIHEPREDTLLGQQVFTGKIFSLVPWSR